MHSGTVVTENSSELENDMKILHVAQSLKGGPATYFDETIPEQVARFGRANIALVVPAQDLQYLSEATRQARIYTFPTRARSAKSLLEFHRTFRQALYDLEPEVIHLHSSFAGAVCRASIIFSFLSPRVIYCSHGWAFDRGGTKHGSFKKRLIIAVEKALSYRTDTIINISEYDQRSALSYGIGAGKSIIVYNGVSELKRSEVPRNLRQVQLGMDPAKINVLFVGRFDHQKGFDLLLDAFQQLDPRRYHLHAIGDFVVTDKGSVEDIAKASIHISLLGWRQREELPPYYAAADVVVMPSRWEGFGLVAAEAMRMETAVLATSVGALPELIKDRVSGRLISSPNAEELVNVLLEEDKDSWSRYGRNAQIHFLQNFTSSRLNSALFNIYSQVTSVPNAMDLVL